MAKKNRSNFGSIFRRRLSDGRPVPPGYRGRCRPGYYFRTQQDGRQVWKKAGNTASEAQEFVGKVQRKIFEERILGVRPVEEINFEKFAEKYIAHVGRVHAESTAKNETKRIQSKVIPEFRHLLVSAVKQEDVARFLEKRSHDGASKSTLNRYAALLSAMFKRAIELGHTRTNPVRGLTRHPEPQYPVPFLTVEDQNKLIAECPDAIRPLVVLALDTGMRRGELLALTWGDVDLGRNVLTIRKSKNETVRDVPLTLRARAVIEQLKTGRVIRLGQPTRVLEWIPESFPGDFNKLYHDAVKAAGFGHLRIHDLRHLAAVNLTRAGVPLADVAKFLGHKALVVTMRYANHSPADAGSRSLAQLEAYLAAGAAKESKQAGG